MKIHNTKIQTVCYNSQEVLQSLSQLPLSPSSLPSSLPLLPLSLPLLPPLVTAKVAEVSEILSRTKSGGTKTREKSSMGQSLTGFWGGVSGCSVDVWIWGCMGMDMGVYGDGLRVQFEWTVLSVQF